MSQENYQQVLMSDKDLVWLKEYQEKHRVTLLTPMPSQSVETFSDIREDLAKLREDHEELKKDHRDLVEFVDRISRKYD